jgi:hypothetical protein
MIKKITYYLLLLLTITSCAQEAEDTIRLIPEGYQGTVLIIFNQEDGTPKEYEGGKRVYKIPENGILKTQFKPNYGVQKHEFFYVNNKGERTEIPFVVTQNEKEFSEKSNDKIYAYLEQTLGKVEKYDPKTKELLYTIQPARTFYVGNLIDIDKDYQEQLNFTFKHHKN